MTKKTLLRSAFILPALLAGTLPVAAAPAWQQAAAPDAFKMRPLYLTNTSENPVERPVCWFFENKTNLTIRGGDILYRGREIPFVFLNCRNVVIEDVTIDCAVPTILPCDIRAVDPAAKTISFTVPASARPGCRLEGTTLNIVDEAVRPGAPLDGVLRIRPGRGILFDAAGHHVFNVSDFDCINFKQVHAEGDGFVSSNACGFGAVRPGHRFAARPTTWTRPAAGIFLDGCEDVSLRNVTISSCSGIGLLAQNTRNIDVRGMKVVRSVRFPGRPFTLQADATHFTDCSGTISVTDSVFEGQMDDAINVHGIYTRAQEQPGARTLVAAFMHREAFGFEWARAGERVRFVDSETMRPVGPASATVASVTTLTPKAFRLVFDVPLDFGATPVTRVCLENLARIPSRVVFARNLCRDNRARGALFSSGARVEVTGNVFDHVSGAAIMVQGDANGWYESGALTNLVIAGNTFRDCLTSAYQSCNAVITIDPIIRRPVPGTFFHSNVSITGNTFEVFEPALLWAHHVDGLVFAANTVRLDKNFPPRLRPKSPVVLRDCRGADIRDLPRPGNRRR